MRLKPDIDSHDVTKGRPGVGTNNGEKLKPAWRLDRWTSFRLLGIELPAAVWVLIPLRLEHQWIAFVLQLLKLLTVVLIAIRFQQWWKKLEKSPDPRVMQLWSAAALTVVGLSIISDAVVLVILL